MKWTAVSARFFLRVLSVQPTRKWRHQCWLHMICVVTLEVPVSFLVAWLSGSARVRAAGVGIICDPPYSHLGPLFAPCLNLSFIVHRWLKRSRGTEQLWHYDRLAKQQSQLVRHWRQEWATLPTGKQSTTYNNTLSLQQEDSALRRWKDMHQQGIRRFLISQQMFTL